MVVVENLSKNENLEGIKYKYIYRLTKRDFPVKIKNEANNFQCFGIEVECQAIVDNSVISIERNSIEKISPYRFKVHNLLKLIYDNSVSPLHLTDIIGEYVDEYVSDFDSVAVDINEEPIHSFMC